MLNQKSFRHFAKHLFLICRIRNERSRAEQEVYDHLKRMREAIIKMKLGYSHIDRLKEKIKVMIEWERRYARCLKPEDSGMGRLKSSIAELENELRSEKEEKQHIIAENREKVGQLTESIEALKRQMKDLLLEKAQRQQRLKVLEEKINGRIDLHHYYHS